MTARAITRIVGVPDDVRCRIRVDLNEAATHRRRQLDLLLASRPEAGTEGDFVVLEQRATLRQLLKQIEVALARIDDDTFGECEHCQVAIPVARLEVRPWTTTCVGCATS